MQSEVERTLHNLHVLSALSHNDKLMTNEDQFDIYTPTTFRGIMRAWYGERRLQNVQRVRQTIRAAINAATSTLDEANSLLSTETTTSHDSIRLRIDTVALQHVRMIDALLQARQGLHNLCQTYRDDAALMSQITLMIGEITDFVNVINPHSTPLRRRSTVISPLPSLPPLPESPPPDPPSC